MKTRFIFLFIPLCIILISACKDSPKKTTAIVSTKSDYSWDKNDKMVALLHEGKIIWKLNFDQEQDKPYFHPLKTPDGYELTLERPKDHPWHRGLWFSWKDINGVNYWEEDPAKGVAEGRSIIKSVNIETNKDFSARVTFEISYEENNTPVITETRKLLISSPVQQDQYTIDWDQTFNFQKDVRLYLEKPAKHGGKEWGGYAGLSFRASDSLIDQRFLASNGWENTADITGYGEKAQWMDMTAKVIGADNQYAGLTIYDSPKNPRYPSPWYVWFTKGEHAFFTPSILFDGPMEFKKDDTLSLEYLVLIHDGKKSMEQLQSLMP